MKETTLAIQIELVVKSFKADAQQLSRAGFVVLRLLQGAHDHLSLGEPWSEASRAKPRIYR